MFCFKTDGFSILTCPINSAKSLYTLMISKFFSLAGLFDNE